MNSTMKKLTPVLAGALLCAASLAPGQATITVDRVSGDGFTDGSRVRFRVAITSNGTVFAPRSVAFRVIYPNTLTWGYDPPGPAPVITVENADLGDVYAAPTTEVISPSLTGRDVATIGTNTASNPLLPICFYVNFTANNATPAPYSIDVIADPDSTAPVFYYQISPPATGSISPLTFVGTTVTYPDISVSAASVTFDPTVELGTTTEPFTINNVATGQELTITSLQIINNADPAGTFTIDTPPALPTDVPPTGNLPLTLRFNPPSIATFNSAVLEIGSNSPGETTITIPLSGSGIAGTRVEEWKRHGN